MGHPALGWWKSVLTAMDTPRKISRCVRVSLTGPDEFEARVERTFPVLVMLPGKSKSYGIEVRGIPPLRKKTRKYGAPGTLLTTVGTGRKISCCVRVSLAGPDELRRE